MSDLIEQASRDLRWLYQCPDLLGTSLSLSLPDPFSVGQELDFSPVERFLATKASYRVGYYVEALIQVWLQAIPGITDVQHGIQIRQGKETLGEIDFLFQREGQLHHLEVALKFYLYSPSQTARGSHFIGPNAADTFERKRDRLLTKQIPMGKTYAPEIAESHVMVKGMIFYPPEEEGPETWPEGLNPEHARGLWLREGDDREFLRGRSGVLLQKPFWLSGRNDLQAESESANLFTIVKSRPKLIRLDPSEDSESAGKDTRLFLVPQSWPGLPK